MIRNVLILAVGLAGLLACWSCGSTTANNAANGAPSTANTTSGTNKASGNSSTAAAPADRKAEISTTADAIYKEYKANSNSMEKYKGKVVEISGKFSKTSGSGDSIQVKFDTGEPALEVACRINPSALQTAAKLEKGQQIKMTGIGDTSSIIGPLFTDCMMAQ